MNALNGEADPVELTKKINNAMENSEDRNQFRRSNSLLKKMERSQI